MLNKKKTYWNTCIKFVISANQSCRWWSRKQCCRGFRLSMPSPLPDSTQTTQSQDAFSVTFQAYRLDQLTYFLLFVKNSDHHYTKRKPTWFFFSFLQSILVWWCFWSSILRAEQEFYFSLTFTVEIYHWNHALIFEGLFNFHFCGICLYFVLYKSVNVFV